MSPNAPFHRPLARIIAALSSGLVLQAMAGDHWLSRVTVRSDDQQEVSMVSSSAVTSGVPRPKGIFSSSQVIFDVTISLDTNPQGDDDYRRDGGTVDEPQKAYERRLEEFARTVYQASNGALKIGRVTIFRTRQGQKRVSSADIEWDENCPADKGPRANLSGFGVSGKRIWMCTNWAVNGGALLSSPQGSGYGLAHEWGHYAYGLYDEYQCSSDTVLTYINCLIELPNSLSRKDIPRLSDEPTVPSIMTNQWEAIDTRKGDKSYLEYSTPNLAPYNGSGSNVQKRMFGESAWETLTRDPQGDPKGRGIPRRTRYMALTAPTSPNWNVQGDATAALSDFDIRWAGSSMIDLSIDTSGSMGFNSGIPIANAKAGASLLIDFVSAGSAIGVSSFSDTLRREFALTDIPAAGTGIRDSAKAAVVALTAIGGTRLFDGLTASLDALKSFAADRPGMVFVLSDGEDTSSYLATEASVIAAYQAARVPIIAFAYGTFAPTGSLFNMANATGGALYVSPTTSADIQAALLAAESRFSSSLSVASASLSVAAGATATRTTALDSTLGSVRLAIAFSGSPTDIEPRLLRPNGTNANVSFTCSGSATCSTTLDAAFLAANGAGDYQVQIVNRSTVSKNVSVFATAIPSTAETYQISAGFAEKSLTFPTDLALRATVSRGGAISGLSVVATVTPPIGSPFDVNLRDDGAGADLVANDGTYSASIPYRANGIYSAKIVATNPTGNASTTFAGVAASVRPDGSTPSLAPIAITERFQRIDVVTANVSGVVADDHAGSPSTGSCTTIRDDNADVVGRIDAAGDADCFRLAASSTAYPLAFRVTSLSSGMDPELTIYDRTGVAVIAQRTLATSENPASGVVVTMSASALDGTAMYLVVRHRSASAATGGYAVSAGRKIISDLATIDTQAPSVPAGLSSAFAGTGQVNLAWSASTDDTGIGSYRVYRNGVLVAVVRDATAFQDSGLQPGSTYAYAVSACDISSNCSARSTPIEVTPPAIAARLINISTRMQVLTGNDVMIGGFVVGGSTPKTVAVRARGPSLVPYGITNALSDPVLQLYSGQTLIASNDDWIASSNASQIQASGFAPSDNLESTILVSLAPGAYTAIVTGYAGGTGVGIVEVFEVDRPEMPLINISTRGQVLTGNDVMIGGFIISGNSPQSVVIRARGPSLAPFGITNALRDPVIQLYSGQTLIGENDDWISSPNASQIAGSGFAPSNDLESTLLVTLAPGAYTVVVTGYGGGTGVGIVEVFAR